MRLLNVHDLTLRDFPPGKLPKYAIASHRWVEDEEASIKDICEGLDLSKSGHRKVKCFAEYIVRNVAGIDWIWLDTCCIDKTSSQEVTEAINSMFKWYLTAEVCLAYLYDVPAAEDGMSFSHSTWFRRGWTLQELLAPRLVVFLTGDWHVIGHKGGDSYSNGKALLHAGPSLTARISTITQIPENVLNDYTQSQCFSAEAKLQWITSRETTLEEDLSYCLLGILEVTMPVIYGEGGDKARKRLLKEAAENGEVTDGTNVSSLSRCVSVPYSTVSTYTERAALSQELEEKLGKPCSGGGLAHAVTVAGLGGTGKTQLVMHYIEMHANEYDTILWLDARSEETANLSFERCCRALSLAVDTSADQSAVKNTHATQAVLHWLRNRVSEQKWLVVVDNADDLSWEISGMIPQGQTGSVIVTSQDSNAARMVNGKCEIVRVDTMTNSEAMALLYNSLDEGVKDGSEEIYHLAERIVALLDNLPLAIDLAVARIRVEAEDGNNLIYAMQRYLTDFERHQDMLLQDEEYARSTSYTKTVWTVWETSLLSLRKLDTEDAEVMSLKLLWLLIMLDRMSIQDELFRLAGLGLSETCQQLSIEVPPWLRELLSIGEDGEWDDFHYRTAVRPLLRYGLVRPITGAWRGLTMHSLVQWRARQEGDSRERWKWFLAFIVAACVQQLNESDVQFRRHMVVHLPSNAKLMEAGLIGTGEQMAWVCVTIGQIWDAEGRHNASQELLEIAWKELAWSLGEEHSDTLTAMAKLGVAYSMQGKEEKAEELKLQVVEIMSRTLGEEHPSTLAAKSNLATTYGNQGRCEDAENLEIDVIDASSRILGVEHLDTLTSMANLAIIYCNQGRWKEAEDIHLEILPLVSRILGDEHPFTLATRTSLGELFRNKGQWKEAEEQFMNIIEASSRILGREHPHTLTATAVLAVTKRNQGLWKDAEALEAQVIEARSKILGDEHRSTLVAIANLAITYQDQGRWKDAEELFIRVIDARSRTLGEEHPDTLSAIANLADIFRDQGKWKEAEEMNVKATEAMLRTLGDEHPLTLAATANLAAIFQNQGRWKEAEERIVKVAEAMKKTLGEEHPDTITLINNLAVVYGNQGRWKDAAQLEAEVVEARSRTLGKEHPDTLSAMTDLASTYWNNRQWKEAEELEVYVMETSLRTLSDEHPFTLTVMAKLAATYSEQERWIEAEELSLKVIDARSRTLGKEHPDTIRAISSLQQMQHGRDLDRPADSEHLVDQDETLSARIQAPVSETAESNKRRPMKAKWWRRIAKRSPT